MLVEILTVANLGMLAVSGYFMRKSSEHRNAIQRNIGVVEEHVSAARQHSSAAHQHADAANKSAEISKRAAISSRTHSVTALSHSKQAQKTIDTAVADIQRNNQNFGLSVELAKQVIEMTKPVRVRSRGEMYDEAAKRSAEQAANERKQPIQQQTRPNWLMKSDLPFNPTKPKPEKK